MTLQSQNRSVIIFVSFKILDLHPYNMKTVPFDNINPENTKRGSICFNFLREPVEYLGKKLILEASICEVLMVEPLLVVDSA